MSRIPFVTVLTVVALAAAGCGHGTTAPAEPVGPPPDARVVLDALAASGLPLTKLATTTVDTDPNGVLGEPDAYISRAAADVPEGDPNGTAQCVRRGLVVEVWETSRAATSRAEDLEMAIELSEVPAEYHFRPADRRLLIRLTGAVPASEAARYETAVEALSASGYEHTSPTSGSASVSPA